MTNANLAEANYFVFIVTDIEWEPFTKGEIIARTLAENNVWLVSQLMPYRRTYQAGDHVLFYVAGRGARYFLGQALIIGPTTVATSQDNLLVEKLGLEGFEERIPLSDVNLWQNPIPIKPYVESLSFIKDKRNYGLNLRQAAARIPASDFSLIVQEASVANKQ